MQRIGVEQPSCLDISSRLKWYGLTYESDPGQRQLLEETSYLDGWQLFLISGTDHGEEAILDTLQYFGIPIENIQYPRVSLLDQI